MTARKETVWLTYNWQDRSWSNTKSKPTRSPLKVSFEIEAEIDIPDAPPPKLKIKYLVPMATVEAVAEGAELVPAEPS